MTPHVAWRLVRRAAVNLWRAPLPSLLAVLTIALALFLGAALAFGVQGARSLLASWGAQPSVTLFLERGMPEAQARALAERIRAQETNVDVAYVSPSQAMDRLRVATLNVWNRQGPWEERLRLIRRGLSACSPDLIGLQEVLRHDSDPLDQARLIVTYGESPEAGLRAGEIRLEASGTTFDVWEGTTWSLGRVRLPFPGRHNVLNALAALS